MNIKQETRVKKILMRDLNRAIKREARLLKRAERKVIRLQAKHDRAAMRYFNKCQNLALAKTA